MAHRQQEFLEPSGHCRVLPGWRIPLVLHPRTDPNSPSSWPWGHLTLPPHLRSHTIARSQGFPLWPTHQVMAPSTYSDSWRPRKWATLVGWWRCFHYWHLLGVSGVCQVCLPGASAQIRPREDTQKDQQACYPDSITTHS